MILVAAPPLAFDQKERIKNVLDVDVRLALRAVAKDRQPGRLFGQTTQEIIGHAVGLLRANNVGESENHAVQVEHETIRRDERLTGQLLGAVGRNGDHPVIIFRDRRGRNLAIDAAAGSKRDPFDTRLAHRLQNAARQQGAVGKINIGLDRRTRNIGVRCEMKHDLMPGDGFRQPRLVAHIGVHHAQPRMLHVVAKVPALAVAEIVVSGDGLPCRQETISQMRPNEPRPTGDEISLCHFCQ